MLLVLLVALLFSASQAGDPVIALKQLDSPLDDIQWANPQTVFILTERGNLYRSPNGGATINNQMSSLTDSGEGIASIHISTNDPSHIFIVGKGATSWISTDMGRSYKASGLRAVLKDIKLHPTIPGSILASSMSKGCHSDTKIGGERCFKQLYKTEDFAQTWVHMHDYVVQFDWAPPIGEADAKGKRVSDTLIYASVHNVKRGDQQFGVWDANIDFVSTKDWFKTITTLVPHGNRFLFGDFSYLFVATVNPLRQTEVSLRISRDNTTRMDFQTALLPVSLTEHSYTILDTSESTVFLHVNHKPFHEGAATGHVYISDWSGLLYSLSLPFNHRAADGKCDFEKVEGLEGIYLANFVEQDEDDTTQESTYMAHGVENGKLLHPKLKTKTVISFDKGAIWSYLQVPTKNVHGHPYTCTNCHLHLHGITDLYGPFYSAKTATGLIMATGNVGSYLGEGPINTYLSRDAGYSWIEVMEGSHIYEFGDHGGLILVANDSEETNEIKYSWDEGLTWNTLQVYSEKFQIENIIIEPEAVAQQFVVYGWKDGTGIVAHIDFSVLHERVCTGHDAPDSPTSDYEIWTPNDGRLGGKCLMGHTTHYTRRKRDASCFNPEQHERHSQRTHCPCTRSDFQCDYGYERGMPGTPDSELCVPANNPPVHQNPDQQKGCSNSYRVTKGYRRVPGDTCLGGAEWDAVMVPCPGSWLGGGKAGKLVLFLFVLLIASLGLVAIGSKSPTIESWCADCRGRIASKGYRLVGSGSNVASMSEDDAFYLNEDEFGPTAHLLKQGQDANDTDQEQPNIPGEFAPLPAASARKGVVPKLAAPSAQP